MRLSNNATNKIINDVSKLEANNKFENIKLFNQKERKLILKAFKENSAKISNNQNKDPNPKTKALMNSICSKMEISVEPESKKTKLRFKIAHLISKFFKGFANHFGRISSRKIENKIIHHNQAHPNLYNY